MHINGIIAKTAEEAVKVASDLLRYAPPLRVTASAFFAVLPFARQLRLAINRRKVHRMTTILTIHSIKNGSTVEQRTKFKDWDTAMHEGRTQLDLYTSVWQFQLSCTDLACPNGPLVRTYRETQWQKIALNR